MFCVVVVFMFWLAIGKAGKCLVGCQVTELKIGKSSVTVLTAWVLWSDKNRVDMLVLEHYILAMEL